MFLTSRRFLISEIVKNDPTREGRFLTLPWGTRRASDKVLVEPGKQDTSALCESFDKSEEDITHKGYRLRWVSLHARCNSIADQESIDYPKLYDALEKPLSKAEHPCKTTLYYCADVDPISTSTGTEIVNGHTEPTVPITTAIVTEKTTLKDKSSDVSEDETASAGRKLGAKVSLLFVLAAVFVRWLGAGRAHCID